MKSYLKSVSYLSVFAIAMGFLESAVVIYLRAIYYPEGFQFPLKAMDLSLAKVEVLREAATVIMLITIAFLSGKTKLQRFAYFTLAFAIWDIFYYVFLYLFLGWPQSLFTWDILFLIPLPWIGPVWAPCLLSLIMITGSLFVIHETSTQSNFEITKKQWSLLIGGALICIVSFIWDYYKSVSGSDFWSPFSTKHLFSEMLTYTPQSFNIPLFFLGFFCMFSPIAFHLYIKLKPKK